MAAEGELEQRRLALRLGPEPLPELGLAQPLDPAPQPALRAHPQAPHPPKPVRMLARSRMGVSDNQGIFCQPARSINHVRIPDIRIGLRFRAVDVTYNNELD